jgi:hypothetical protein
MLIDQAQDQQRPDGIELRPAAELEGMIELAAPESLYLVLAEDLTPDGKNAIVFSNLPIEIAGGVLGRS